jgi:hemoglobin-like flavoprotein
VFAHEIVREVVADALLPSTRAALHRRAARALDRRIAFRRQHLDLVAAHYAAGASDGDAERAIEILLEAARAGAGAGAFDVAARHTRTAIEVDALLPAERSTRAALHLELGTALSRGGQLEEAAIAFAAGGPRFSREGSAQLHAAFFAIADELPRALERFYELLFERHPEARALFVRSQPAMQRRMFGETLGALVEHAGDDAWLDEHLRAMGERHRGYGISDAMYDWVRDAFLDALGEACGRAGLPDAVKASWASLYDRAAAKMIDAGRGSLIKR